MNPTLSIITPTYNASHYLPGFLRHAEHILRKSLSLEWIIVDDGSNDNTLELLQDFKTRSAFDAALTIISSPENKGPGAARNTALDNATGEWLIFLDADDKFNIPALHSFISTLALDKVNDVISFSWSDSRTPQTKLKKDRSSLLKTKDAIISDYLSLKMDGSVIFSAIRHNLIKQYSIRFHDGIHEDIDYLFKVYWHATNISVLDELIYIKDSRDLSIVNSISQQHIEGFYRAYLEIKTFLKKENAFEKYKLAYLNGVISIAATRIRNTSLFDNLPTEKITSILNTIIYYVKSELPADFKFNHTQYHQLTHLLLNTKELSDLSVQKVFFNAIAKIASSTWSCKDLEHSLFLAPDQIRACCKRFFVGSEIKGDVVLIDKIEKNITLEEIKQAKANLKASLNNGSKTECDGCPYLEFKDWGQGNIEQVKYLSFEQHSVCNLRCSYCDEKYYGGAKCTYDLTALFDSKSCEKFLKKCETVVWGGGEPSMGRDFNKLLPKIIEETPNAIHRILSNSVKFSPTIFDSLDNPNIKLVTSIDAGTDDTFLRVRGKSKLSNVINNLEYYASKIPENITIKYILRPDNSAFSEVFSFINLMKCHPELKRCNFQISCDFKDEILSTQVVSAAITLFGLLITHGYNSVFFDDLLRARLSSICDSKLKEIKERLGLNGYINFLADSDNYKEVIVWGTGFQSKFLLENSLFFKKSRVSFFVVDKEYYHNDSFQGVPVFTPEKLHSSNLPILIAASQSYEQIRKKLKNHYVCESRILKKVII